VPVLARVAGGLAVAGAVVRLVATVPPAASSGGTDLGGLQNVADLIPPLPLVVLVAAAGLLCTRGVLPRLGLAALLSAGTLSAGPLLRTLWLLDTGSRSTTDLPLGIATSARYEAGAGLVLLAVAYGLLVAAAVAAGLAWSRTVMEDDGGFDPRRPELAAWGLLVGIFAGLAFGMSPFTSAIGLDPGPVPERSGAALPGGLVLSLGAAVWAVVAATLRPRLAVVGAYAGLLAVLAAEALGTLLLVVRSPALGAGAGTVGSVLAVLAVAALLLAAAPVRPLARRPR
jgi:hypothetical protein